MGRQETQLKNWSRKRKTGWHNELFWLKKHYPKNSGTSSLSPLSLDINEGENDRVCLARSGSGKPRCCYYFAGLEGADTGVMVSIWRPQNVPNFAHVRWSSRRFCIQNYALLSFIMTVADNVAILGWKSCLVKNAQAFLKYKRRVSCIYGHACSLLTLLTVFRIAAFWFGQKQVIAVVARALATQPEVTWLLDEPFGRLRDAKKVPQRTTSLVYADTRKSLGFTKVSSPRSKEKEALELSESALLVMS